MKNLKKLAYLFTLLAMSLLAVGQNVPITGTVTDASGKGITGINVTVKGGKQGTATKADGSFSIGAPANSTLVFSGVGFISQEMAIGGRSTVNITLAQNQNELSTVVVTALGISKESRRVGYSVSTVNGDQMTQARETNVALSLEGQVAGLDVHGTSGGPGSTARILLRGMPSINSGGSPLFVINGIPIDNQNRGSASEWGGSDNGDGISNINPDDIETMTVLKGQSASALYGARATNGVILITTKTGKKGNVSIDYNTNNVIDKAINYTDYQYVYGQGQRGAKPANATAALNSDRLSWGAKMDGTPVLGYDGKTYAYSPFKDNLKNFYRTGPTFTNTISVSSGGDRGTFRLSASDLSNSAIVRNSGIERRTLNLNLDQKLTDRLGVTVLANYIDEQDRNRPQLSDGPGNPNNFLFLASNVNENIFKPGYDASGNEIVFSDDNYVTNPWFVVSKWINNLSRKRLITGVTAKYNFTSWIYALTRITYDNINDRYFNVAPTGTNYTFNSAGQSGQLDLRNTQTSELNLDGLIGVTHKLVSDLNLDATIGVNSRKNNYETIDINSNGGPFVIPGLYTPGNVVKFGRSYDAYEKEIHSAFYTVDFTYKNFLTLNTTGRYDAYSTLYNSSIPKGQRDIFTPSVSASFLFSEVVHIPSLNYGKLRASYAVTSGEPGGGTNNSGTYQTAVYYGTNNSINGVPTGTFSSSLPNLFLKPFTLNEFEVGTELKFLNSRLGFDIAYYTRTTHHEIIPAQLSIASGYTSSVIGTGSTLNRGLEVQITGSPVKGKSFTWNITYNATFVHNRILETDAKGTNLSLGTYRPLNGNTAFVKGMSGPQILAHDYTYDSKHEIVVDASGLPIQGAEVPMGSVLPTFYGGLRNEFLFGNLNFSFLLDYNFGNKILSATSNYTMLRGLNKATLVGRETGITTGVTAAGAANTVSADAQDYYTRLATISRVNVLDGDYIKLRQVTLGYTFSNQVLGNIPVFQSITVSLVGRNLLCLMRHSANIDPEAGFNASIQYAGIEGTSLPSTRTFGINVNFKFKK